MYDLIGDVHGHANELKMLLERMGYRRRGNGYAHPERRAIFVGDLIDRGPQIREVLWIVRTMVDEGAALCVMGNHEFNAIGYHTENPRQPGTHFRPRNEKTTHQHAQTLAQVEGRELAEWIEWFKTRPLWLELDELRVVHACWHRPSIERVRAALNEHGGFTVEFLAATRDKDSALFCATEETLKGKEAWLPVGEAFPDKDGHSRRTVRLQWFQSPEGRCFGRYAFPENPVLRGRPIPEAALANLEPYPPQERPVFFGHYWLSAERPSPLAGNVACLDYSVAKAGLLCAYRWSGEPRLVADNFVWVRSRSDSVL